MWRSLGNGPNKPRLRRYRATIAKALFLMAFLVVAARVEGFSIDDLGLELALGTGGLIGLGVASALVIAMVVATTKASSNGSNEKLSEATEIMPQTDQETRVFIFLSVVIGFAWEVLYRGFLFWWLTPMTGVVGAVLIAGVAYGLAHGWENHRQGVGSIVSALLFCTGYALTGSLWWLIVIHIALPLIGLMAMRKAGEDNLKSTAP